MSRVCRNWPTEFQHFTGYAIRILSASISVSRRDGNSMQGFCLLSVGLWNRRGCCKRQSFCLTENRTRDSGPVHYLLSYLFLQRSQTCMRVSVNDPGSYSWSDQHDLPRITTVTYTLHYWLQWADIVVICKQPNYSKPHIFWVVRFYRPLHVFLLDLVYDKDYIHWQLGHSFRGHQSHGRIAWLVG